LGSVVEVTNSSGTVIDTITYDAWGNATESSPGLVGRYQWTGREPDSGSYSLGDTGLQYNRGRYYDPSTGRWLSQDPLGFDAGDSNLYRYVNNEPTGATDPSGKYLIANDAAAADYWINYLANNYGGIGATKVLLSNGKFLISINPADKGKINNIPNTQKGFGQNIKKALLNKDQDNVIGYVGGIQFQKYTNVVLSGEDYFKIAGAVNGVPSELIAAMIKLTEVEHATPSFLVKQGIGGEHEFCKEWISKYYDAARNDLVPLGTLEKRSNGGIVGLWLNAWLAKGWGRFGSDQEHTTLAVRFADGTIIYIDSGWSNGQHFHRPQDWPQGWIDLWKNKNAPFTTHWDQILNGLKYLGKKVQMGHTLLPPIPR